MEVVRHIQGNKGLVPVWRLKRGEKVSQSGVYDMPMPVYHGDCCVGPSISSTGLRTIQNQSPLHYWDSSIYNPDRLETDTEDAEAKAFRVGRAVHCLVLEPHLFHSQNIARPPIFPDWRTAAAKRWRGEQQMEGKTVLDPADLLQINGMAAALKAHPLYQDGILDGDIELSLIWQDELTGIWLKARPDAIPRGTNMLADLKSTNDASTEGFGKKLYSLGYDMQIALGGIGMEKLLGRVVDEYLFVAIESARPHGIRIAPVPMDEIGRARSLLRAAVNTFAECLASGLWPSYEKDDNEYIFRNSFKSKVIDALVSAGVLPKEF